MRLMARLLAGALVVLGLSLPSTLPASADVGDAGSPVGRWSEKRVLVYPHGNLRGWHTERAIEAWHALGVVDITIVTAPCTGMTGCITVWQTAPRPVLGVEAWDGLALPSYQQSPADYERRGGVLPMSECSIMLNNTTPRFWRGFITLHEMGHCLGLPHSAEHGSAMNDDGRYPATAPSPYDAGSLRSLYTG